MKNTIIILAVTLFCFGCNSTTKQLHEKIDNADSIAINYFKGDGTMDTVVAVKIVKDKKAIDKVSTFVLDNSVSAKSNCGYDGSLHFFKNDTVVQDVFFSSSQKECRQFSFVIDGKNAASTLTETAATFLSAIKNK